MIRYFWAVPCSVIQWGNREGKTEPLFLAFFDIFPHCVFAFLLGRRVYRLAQECTDSIFMSYYYYCYYLTPPPSSADVERLFSTAGHIYSDDRNRLKPENLDKLLFRF